MSYSSSDQQLSSIRPALPFVGGMVLGFLPLIILLSCYVRISPLYPHDPSFNLCSGDPGAGGRAIFSVILYLLEWPAGLILAVAASWSKKSGWWVLGLFIALVLDFFIFYWIIVYAFGHCGPVFDF